MFPGVRDHCLAALLAVAVGHTVFGTAGQARELDAKATQAMVVVEGDGNRGAAFVVKMDGKPFLLTSAHTLQGNRTVRFKDLRNAVLTAGTLQLADSTDAVRGELTGASAALELEPAVDKIRIGDGVIVASASEGAGVVREIPGRVVAVGPERIEVSAEFGESDNGSPILLKSTGRVIGVAVCLNIPRKSAETTASPVGFQETHRFGYRLDTASRWITAASNERLLMEGLKLAELENFYGLLAAVLNNNAATVAKSGGSAVKSRKNQQYPTALALAGAIDEFAKHHLVLRSDGDRTKNATAFFARLKGIVLDEVRGLNESQFSGFAALQLKEALTRFKDFTDWCDGQSMPAFRAAWLAGKTEPRPPATPGLPASTNDNPVADAGRPATAAELALPLKEFLRDTKWLWEGSKDHVLQFRKDGKVSLDYWSLATDWKVTGPNEVTFIMHKKPEDVTSTVTFTDDRSSFSGVAFVKTRMVRRTPRAPAGN
jgi:hypothetical protein